MNSQNKDQAKDKPVPSTGPLKNEPTPERAKEEKQKQADQAAGAEQKPSGAV